jgi:hypothetical protein
VDVHFSPAQFLVKSAKNNGVAIISYIDAGWMHSNAISLRQDTVEKAGDHMEKW